MKKILVSLFLASFTLASMWFLFKGKTNTSLTNSKSIAQEQDWLNLIKAIKKIHYFWESGDYPYLAEMPCNSDWDPSYVSREFLKCNAEILQCHLSYLAQDGKVEFGEPGKSVFVKKDIEFVAENKVKDGIVLNLKFGRNQERRVNFQSRCHESYLPQGNYTYSPLNKENSLDNIDREESKQWVNDKNIFVDKFLVTRKDYNQLMGQKLKREQRSYFPVDNISLKQMRSYCERQGKKLLSAKIYDAMTYSDLAKIDLFEDISKTSCNVIYTKDCIGKTELKFQDTNNVSWMGTYDIRGGILEAVDNNMDKDFNIVSSSFYFKSDSFWHNLTHRFQWNGQNHREVDFRYISSVTGEKLKLIESNDIKVGFRCYREI